MVKDRSLVAATVLLRTYPLLSRPPPVLHLTSEFLLPVAGHLAMDALGLGPTGTLAETHAAVLAAGGAGSPGPLRTLAALLHLIYKAQGTKLRTWCAQRLPRRLAPRSHGLTCPPQLSFTPETTLPHHLFFWPPRT